jgi:hypothetical protein
MHCNNKIQIKSLSGMYVSADRNMGNSLIANRKEAYDWETFELIPK